MNFSGFDYFAVFCLFRFIWVGLGFVCTCGVLGVWLRLAGWTNFCILGVWWGVALWLCSFVILVVCLNFCFLGVFEFWFLMFGVGIRRKIDTLLDRWGGFVWMWFVTFILFAFGWGYYLLWLVVVLVCFDVLITALELFWVLMLGLAVGLWFNGFRTVKEFVCLRISLFFCLFDFAVCRVYAWLWVVCLLCFFTCLHIIGAFRLSALFVCLIYLCCFVCWLLIVL